MDKPRRSIPARRTARWAGALALLLAAPPLGCAVNPATGRSELSLIGESQEVALGRQNHSAILQQMGPYNDPALQNYVQTLGRELARGSERPQLPWTFTLLDDTAINAFALPGGYIYVTRGILSHMNSEGELAGVLGHEIGHVTARHSVAQMSRAQVANLGLVLGSVVAPQLQQMGETLQQGVGLLLLKYGRDAERQADDLGLRYMTRQGYPPGELAEILGVLDRVERAQGGSRTPDWLATHPAAADRVTRIRAAARSTPAANTNPSDRRSFLMRLQNLPFGENPREGFFEGDAFFHPELAIQMELPRDWKRQNTKAALQAASSDGGAALSVSVSAAQDARQAANQFFANQQGGPQPGQARTVRAGGFEALEVPFAAVASNSGARIAGRVRFVQDGQRVYQLLAYGLEDRYRRLEPVLERSLGSFSRLRDGCRLDVRPARIEIIEARRGMTIGDLLRGAPSDVTINTLAILNHVDPAAPLEPGQLYKRIAGGQNRC
jgi:predicted Zn-dependent protease